MLKEKEGSAQALRKLISERLVPMLEAGESRRCRLLLAVVPDVAPSFPGKEIHHYPELCFCVDGAAEIWCGPSLERLAEGDVLVIPPQVPHSGSVLHYFSGPPEKAHSRLFWLRSFPYGAVVNICETIHGRHHSTTAQVFLHRRIHPVIESLIAELTQSDLGYRKMAASHLIQALIWICRGTDVASAGQAPSEAEAVTDHATNHSAAGRARRFIHESFDSLLDLDTIARAAGTSKSQLCREFRSQFGVTVMDYLTGVRVDAARRLLQAQMRVSHVAQFVGFPDPYHFSRVFKRHTGLSPRSFAEQYVNTVHPA